MADAYDPYGNLATSFNGPVTVGLASGPGGSALAGTATVAAVDGVATFSGLTLNDAGSGYSLKASANGLASVTTTPFAVSPSVQPPNPTIARTITSAQVLKVKMKNNKGKPTGKTALQFSLKYSTTMNQSFANLRTNYQVEKAIKKGNKKKKTTTYKTVGFAESYNSETNTVTLTITAKQPFTSGGKIIINAAPPNGVSSEPAFS